MARSNKTLDDLFEGSLGEIYHAGTMTLKVLPKMVKAARAESLRTALERRAGETGQQIARLDSLYEAMGRDADPQPCAAMRGLVGDAKDLIDRFKRSDAIDVALTGAGLAIASYEIARYEALQAMALRLGRTAAAAAIETGLGEARALRAALGASQAGPVQQTRANGTGGRAPVPAKPAARRAPRPDPASLAVADGPKTPKAPRRKAIATELPLPPAARRARRSPRKPAPAATPS